jgi:heterodisulfide reductase subunit A
VKTALDLKSQNPDLSIYILYRDMRTFGQRERLYLEARRKGIIFIRYDLDRKPAVEKRDGEDGLKVTVFDPILGREIELITDLISLQTAIVATGSQDLAKIFRVDLDRNGFVAESPQKMKPLETSIPGVYMAGIAHYPKDTTESITQAKGAAGLALEILRRDAVQAGGLAAEVRPERCAVCCTCVRTCPFGVPWIDHAKGAAYIDPGMCQGCGICVAECPGKAIAMSGCSDDMLTKMPSVLLGVS